MTETQERAFTVDMPEVFDTGPAKPEDVAHYVDQRFEQDVTAAMINGTELVALCGYRWVPSRDALKLPVCQPCIHVLHSIIT